MKRIIKYDDAVRFRIRKKDRKDIQRRAKKCGISEAEIVRKIILCWLSKK